MSVENLGQYLSTIEDPRCSGKVERSTPSSCYSGSTQHSRCQPQSSTGQLTKTGRYVAGLEDRRGRIRLGRF